jgi:DNA repair protein RadC
MTVKKAKSVKYWPDDERLCKRFIAHGPASLSNEQLFAIIIKEGKAGRTAWTLPWRSL